MSVCVVNYLYLIHRFRKRKLDHEKAQFRLSGDPQGCRYHWFVTLFSFKFTNHFPSQITHIISLYFISLFFKVYILIISLTN